MKDFSNPLVSFYMTVKNGQEVVSDAIESILDQTYENIELIIVDDGSSDDTIQVVKSLAEQDGRIKLIESGGVGRARALNIAVSNAAGNYLLNLDADDYAHPSRAELQVGFMEREGMEFVASKVFFVFDDEKPCWDDSVGVGNYGYEIVGNSIAYKNSINHSSVALSRSLVDKFMPLYNEDRQKQIDHDLWIKLQANGALLSLMNANLVAKRIHSGQSFENKYRAKYLWSSLCLKFTASLKMGAPLWVYPYLILKFFYGFAPQYFRVRLKERFR